MRPVLSNQCIVLSIVFTIATVCCLSSFAFAHPGAVDRLGGHFSKSPLSYHFHADAIVARRFLSDESAQPPASTQPVDRAFVQEVLNGHTIRLSNGKLVRLIGVADDRAGLAFMFTKTIAERSYAWLVYDDLREDSDGATLAYLYLPDGTFVNAELIRQGFASVSLAYPFRLRQTFLRLQAATLTT